MGLSTAAWAQSGEGFLCPDDGQIDPVASNVAGTSDKVVTVDPSNNNRDDGFIVQVYDNATGMVLDEIEITDNNPHSITMPPGARTRIEDPDDGDNDKPQGTVMVTPG